MRRFLFGELGRPLTFAKGTQTIERSRCSGVLRSKEEIMVLVKVSPMKGNESLVLVRVCTELFVG
jgi:hypothetical protein